jgi:tetratricopeptide (TPR) repeat protein
MNPKSAALYNNLGLSCYLMGDNARSMEAFIAALRIDPENTKIYNNLGLVFSKLGRHEEAFEAFKKGKDEAGAYNNLGYVYMAEQNYAEAIKAFERAIELNPGFYEKAHQNIQRARSAMKIEVKQLSVPANP